MIYAILRSGPNAPELEFSREIPAEVDGCIVYELTSIQPRGDTVSKPDEIHTDVIPQEVVDILLTLTLESQTESERVWRVQIAQGDTVASFLTIVKLSEKTIGVFARGLSIHNKDWIAHFLNHSLPILRGDADINAIQIVTDDVEVCEGLEGAVVKGYHPPTNFSPLQDIIQRMDTMVALGSAKDDLQTKVTAAKQQRSKGFRTPVIVYLLRADA